MGLKSALDNYGFIKFDSEQNNSTIQLASKIGSVIDVKLMPLVQTLTPKKIIIVIHIVEILV